MSEGTTPVGQLLIYSDAGLNLQVRLDGQTVWLTQAQMAELYQTPSRTSVCTFRTSWTIRSCGPKQLSRNT